jgi:hypothetical protein
MKINQNHDITIYRGEAGVIDFKISQRSDYYVPFLISSERTNPMICITIGSARRESKNIVTKQLWLELPDDLPLFELTTVYDLTEVVVDLTDPADIGEVLTPLVEEGILYQFIVPGSSTLHFVYIDSIGDLHIDDYHFYIVLTLDEDITLDMTNTEYFYQIDLMDTVPMTTHLIEMFDTYPELLTKMPADFINNEDGVEAYKSKCIDVINKAFPNHWGHRISNPYTSPVASVSNIQIILPPRNFIVQSVVK